MVVEFKPSEYQEYKVYAAHHTCAGSLKRFFPGMKIIGSREILEEAKQDADLVIFTGGEDVNPKLYHQENLHSSYNNLRDEIEIEIFNAVMETERKILGICRGHQLINVLLGGLLVQDIFSQLGSEHRGGHTLFPIFELMKNPVIPNIFERVNSLHHQGVIYPGKGLTPTSIFGGVFESCEGGNIITVQFHPEWMDDDSAHEFFNYIEKWIGDQ